MTSLDKRRSLPALATAYGVCGLSIASSLTFFVTGVAPLPVLLYFPLHRRFGFHSHAAELSMDYYGRSLLALLGGCAVGLIVYLLTAPGRAGSPEEASESPAPKEGPADRGDADRSDQLGSAVLGSEAERRAAGQSLPLLAAYCLTAALLAAGLFAYQLAARIPNPEPLPTAAHGPRI